MKFFKRKINYGQNNKSNKTDLIEAARSLMQDYWNTSANKIHFLVSRVTCRHIYLICMYEGNDLDINNMKTAEMIYMVKLLNLAGLENKEPNEEQEFLEISFYDFMENLRLARNIYSDLELAYNPLKIDLQQEVIPEKLFDTNIEPVEKAYSFIPSDELTRIRCSENTERDDVDRPVHYLVYSNNRKVIDEINEDLIYRLRKYKRITSRRYLEISRNNIKPWDKNNYRIGNLNNLDGGLVIVNLDDTVNDDFEVLVNSVYSEPGKYKGKYTVIFNLCEADDARVSVIKRICDFWSFVVISDGKLERAKAIKLLDQIAEENDVVLIDSYYDEILEPGKKYLRDELIAAFRKWYLNRYNIRKNYPAYTTYIINLSNIDELSCPSYHELESLIGLKNVKTLCKDIISFYQMEKLRKEKYSSLKDIGMHMVFQGNPGTAKTTVARIMARIFKEKGILSKGDLIEVGRANLVEKYVGQTAPNVKSYFEKAKGSVLFIDEAYSLADGEGKGSYGTEAINTIVQEMENNRDDVVVIFAGYKKEMKEFLKVNSGLSSRISFFVDFPDYSDDELFEILTKMAKDNHYTLADDVRSAFENYINSTVTSIGNGRFVRNAFERARIRQSSRICKLPVKQLTKELFVLSGQDFGGLHD